MTRQLKARVGDETGEVTAALLMFLAVMSAMFLVVHALLIYNGRQVVDSAAQDALHAAQLEGATESDGQSAAQSILALSPGLENIDVDVAINEEDVTVTVQARVTTPFFNLVNTVTSTATGPREQFYEEAERASG